MTGDRPHLELANGVGIYQVPQLGVSVRVRAAKSHSDGRVTAILQFTSDTTGLRIPGSGLINLSAPMTRSKIAKDLEEAAPIGTWLKVLDDLYLRLQEALTLGEPWEVHRSDLYPGGVQYLVSGLLPMNEITIVYGDGESGKSMFVLLLGVLVAAGASLPSLGIPAPQKGSVLYLDWERSSQEHKRRLFRLASGIGLSEPTEVVYRRFSAPLVNDIEAVSAAVAEFSPSLLIVDSLLMAAGTGGDHDPAAPAQRLFAALKGLKVTTCIIGHHGKNAEKGLYGSSYYRLLASSVWRCRAHRSHDEETLSLGLFHEKSNLGKHASPIGVELQFNDSNEGAGPITACQTSVMDIPEVGDSAPLGSRILALLPKSGPLTLKDISEQLDVSYNTVKQTCRRLEGRKEIVRLTSGRLAAVVRDEAPF